MPLADNVIPSISLELGLLITSLLFFLSLMASKAGYKFGVPALLLFLSVGMLFGSDGLGIQFENFHITQVIGSTALCIILFSGGLDTKINEIRPVVVQGVLLATAGVLLTAFLLGLFIWWILGMTIESASIGFITALLLASTISSTDSASVFSILRSKGIKLKHNLGPTLELESGSNDPMAYILTITLTSVIAEQVQPNYWMVAGSVLLQLLIGAAAGFLMGKLAVRIINTIRLNNDSLYPILLFTICIFIFSAVYFMKGNAFLAVYIAGLIIGNSRFVNKRNSLNFFDGQAWLSQLVMFLTLGLLVNPHELLPLIVPGILIFIFLVIVARPVSVFLCLAPFKKIKLREKSFISWVGLRGAVPIIFAIIPLSAGIPHARLIFNIVFLCTLLSLIIQGTTLGTMAKWLHLTEKPKKLPKLENFDVQLADEIESVLTEMEVTPRLLANGNTLKDMYFPAGTLVMIMNRDEKYFVPKGDTVLKEGDKLLIISDNLNEEEEDSTK